MTVDGNALKARVEEFWGRLNKAAVRAGRAAQDIKVVPAVKTQPPEVINALCGLGFDTVGENRADEVVAKHGRLNDGIGVHFIGRLQTNKVRQIIDKVSMVQSLDRPSLAQELNKQAERRGVVMPVLVEVNMGGEAEKGGVSPDHAKDFVKSVLDSYGALKLCGIMCVLPIRAETKLYLHAAKLYDILCGVGGSAFRYLSMGMSEDFDVAVECGANMIRPGRVLTGDRIFR